MSTQEEQLIELMLELKKTTPQQARSILTSTPQIAYALVALMVKMNAIDVQVLQKTLSTYSANMLPPPAPPPTQPSTQIQPASAVPPHFSQYRTPTPQSHTPPHYNGHGHTPQPSNQVPYIAQSQGLYTGPTGFGTPPPAAPQMNNVGLPDALSSIPEEQKAMIMRVIAMTPEQINMLPAPERAGIIQLRTTLGLHS
ncbi:hypothetical protein HD554DRAFT_1178907 [Boletus coccyginus]|nr:hypothetical protein HD554DRAFT_1178907 [Boletus coccyginus]